MPNNLTISVGADTAKLRADLALAQVQLKEFAAQLRNVAQESQQTGDTSKLKEAAANYEHMRSTVVSLSKELRGGKEAAGEAGGAFREIGSAFRELGASMREFRTSIAEMADRIIPHFKEVAELTFAAAAVELTKMTIEAASATREVTNLAHAFGINVEFLEKLKLAGAQAGAEPERQTTALSHLMEKIGEARKEILSLQQDIANGVKGAEDKARQTLNTFGDSGTIFRGGVRPVVDFSKPLSVLGINVAGFADSKEGNEKAIIAIGAAFDRMTSATLRATVARELFGRGWENELPVFLKLRDQLQEAERVMERFGLNSEELERDQKRQAESFNKSYETLKFVIEQERKIVGNALGEALVPLMDGFTELLGRNTLEMKRWATDVAKAARPVVTDILGLLSGGALKDVKTPWLQDFLGALRTIGQAIVFVKDVAVGAFNAVSAALKPVADLMNSAFGTHLNGEVLTLSGLIFGLAGGFTALAAAIAVASAAWAVFRGIGGLGALALGARGAAAGAEAAGAGASALAGGNVIAAVIAAITGAAIGTGMKSAANAQRGDFTSFNGIDAPTDPFGLAGNARRLQTVAEAQIPPLAALKDAASETARALRQVSEVARGPGAGTTIRNGIEDPHVRMGIEDPHVRWTNDVRAAMDGFKQTTQALKEGVAEQTTILKGGAHEAVETLKTANGQMVTVLRGTLGAMATEVVNTVGGAVTVIRGLKPNYRPVQPYTPADIPGLSGIGGGAQGVAFAGGGAVFGAGTETSDSIPAWLSHGEFVMNARAVRNYGVQFMSMLNGMRLPRFAFGGLADAFASITPFPRFAEGGLAGGYNFSPSNLGSPGTPVVINIGGWETTLWGHRDQVDGLAREANRLRASSGGRKPSWDG